MDYRLLHRTMVELTLTAGKDSLVKHRSGEFTRSYKADGSIVTSADLEADRIITEGLNGAFPGIPVISEEGDNHVPPDSGCFFLVDPIDATRKFASGDPEYTINIAYVEDNFPLMGAVYAPAQGWICHNDADRNVYSQRSEDISQLEYDLAVPIVRPPVDMVNLRTIISRSLKHGEIELGMLDGYEIRGILRSASSVKFNLLVTGEADIYPRMRASNEWDTAAGDALLRASGGETRTVDGDLLVYGKPNLLNPSFYARVKGLPII